MNVEERDVIARSKDIEILSDTFRCRDAEYTKFYCMKVRIYFDNGEVKDFMMRSHGDPKGLINFKENKKGIKDNMKDKFLLLKNGEIIFKSWES